MEVGTVKITTPTIISFVLAEHWPAASFVARSLGCVALHTYVERPTPELISSLKHGGLEDTLLTLDELKGCIRGTVSQKSQCWIHGSELFVESLLPWILDHAHLDLYFIISDRHSRHILRSDILQHDFTWFALSHREVGGILQGAWKIGARKWKNLPEIQKKSKVTPGIRDYISSIVSGKETQKLSHVEVRAAGLLSNMDLIPRKDILQQNIYAPCVFTDSKWCRRRLTVPELMDIFDFEVRVKRGIIKHVTSPSLAFVQEPPGKLLHRLMASERTPVISTVIDDEDVSCPKCPLSDVERATVGSTEIYDADSAALKRPSSESSPPSKDPSSQPSVSPSQTEAPAVESSADPENHADAATAQAKAARADDAPVDEDEWNKRAANGYFPGGFDASENSSQRRAFSLMRMAMLRWYKRNLNKSFLRYLHSSYGPEWHSLLRSSIPEAKGGKRKRKPVTNAARLQKNLRTDLEIGRDALRRAGFSTFMDWTGGSTLYFWRWPKEYMKRIRDGLQVLVAGKLPSYHAPQQFPGDPVQRERMRQKLAKVCATRKKGTDYDYVNHRGYIGDGLVSSRTNCFAVDKGEHDIRMVYDASKSQLNAALWAPGFMMPNIDSVLNNATLTSWFGDIDLGEMFLNYFLDPRIRPYAGVDVTLIGDLLRDKSPDEKKLILMRWERSLMGLKPSPYNCTRAFAWGEDFVRGDRRDPKNPFRWDKVVLNMPGTEDYDPRLPWVFRYDSVRGQVAAFFCTYVDDIRSGDCSELECVATTHAIASRVNYLGQQDAPRKRRKISQQPGAWAGAMVAVSEAKGLYVTCSQQKWDKTKGIIHRILDSCPEGGVSWKLDRKTLEKDRGFLIHISRTFPMMVPYLRRIHHTLENWRIGRDDEGWKYTSNEWMQYLDGLEDDFEVSNKEDRKLWKDWKAKAVEEHQDSSAPATVDAVLGLKQDVGALAALFESEEPQHRLVRGTALMRAIYGFGDASGSGFGGSWKKQGTIKYRFGLWGSDLDDSSSNHRELKNLADMVFCMENDGDLEGTELFIFTDNSTAERAFFKGSSKSKILHDLVLRLRKLEMTAGIKLHFVHVSGTRMITQGSDGLSRGNLSEGVMRGEEMSSFIPLHLSALARSKELKIWITSWFSSLDRPLEFLEPIDWYERGHDIKGSTTNCDGQWLPEYLAGCYIWSPPPAAAAIVLEELRKARQKRQDSAHLFICPRLMYPYWQRHLFRAADLIIEIPAGQSYWSSEMHEPLILALFFPYVSCKPWELKRCPKFVEVERVLRGMLKANSGTEGSFLQQLCKFSSGLQDLSAELVWQLLQKPSGLGLPDRNSRKRRRSQMEKEG